MHKMRKMFLSFQGDTSSRDELSHGTMHEEFRRRPNKRVVVSVLSEASERAKLAAEIQPNYSSKKKMIQSGRNTSSELQENDMAKKAAPRKVRINNEAKGLSQQVQAELSRLNLQLKQWKSITNGANMNPN